MNYEKKRFRLSRRQILTGSLSVIFISSIKHNLSPRQEAIILGNILGDGHLQLSPNSKKTRLRFNHSMSQSQYVEWQYKELGSLCKGVSPPKEIVEKERYHICRAYTSYCSELTPYHTLTYQATSLPNRKFVKRIPPNLSDYLKDPEALMVWYLDDGTLRLDGGACRLATQSFSLQEHEILQDTLWKNFHIKSVIESWSDKYPSLYIPARKGYASDFVHLFSDTVIKEIPSMTYKIKKYV